MAEIVRLTEPQSPEHQHWELILDSGDATFNGDWPPAGEENIADDYRQVLVDIQIEDDGPSNTAEVRLKPYTLGTSGDTGGEQSAPWVKADMPMERAQLLHIRKLNIDVAANLGDVRVYITACELSTRKD